MMFSARPKQRITPFDNPLARFLAGRFGVGLFLVSLGMLFAATLVAFVVIRVRLDALWPRDLPMLPPLLWLSTLVLLLSSLSLQWSVLGIRQDQPERLRVGLLAATALGFIFLALQSVSWWTWLGSVDGRWSESGEYRFALTSFFVLTGLHALHVIGGLVPMVLVTRNAGRGRYTMAQHAGVHYTAMYWHFLGAVWLVLYAALLIGT